MRLRRLDARVLQRSRASGFTLLEMLVALLVLSFGLLGMAGLQATALRNNNNAYQRTQATVIALDIFERMRANRVAAANGEYELAMNVNPPASPSTQSERDLSLWINNIRNPNASKTDPDRGQLWNGGDGSVTCALVPPANRFVECTVIVQWAEIQDKAQGGADTSQFTMSSRL